MGHVDHVDHVGQPFSGVCPLKGGNKHVPQRPTLGKFIEHGKAPVIEFKSCRKIKDFLNIEITGINTPWVETSPA